MVSVASLALTLSI